MRIRFLDGSALPLESGVYYSQWLLETSINMLGFSVNEFVNRSR